MSTLDLITAQTRVMEILDTLGELSVMERSLLIGRLLGRPHTATIVNGEIYVFNKTLGPNELSEAIKEIDNS